MKFIFVLRLSMKVKSDHRSKFTATITLTTMITLHFHLPQYNMNFIYISHHFTAREDMNSTNWPRSQCVASQLSWSSIAQVSWRSGVRIPLKAFFFFRLLPSNCLNWKIYCNDHSSLSIIIIIVFLHPCLKLNVKSFRFHFPLTDTDESFLAHCAVFKTMNYTTEKDVPIRQRR